IIGSTRKLEPAPFADEVHDMGDFVKQYPEILGEDVVIVSRELEHGPDGRRLDFLVYDTEFNRHDPLSDQPAEAQIDAEDVDIEKIKIFIVAPKIAPVVAELAQYISVANQALEQQNT